MVGKSWALASLVALATLASAEPERPRIYFPRSVKREFGNSSSITTFVPPAETPDTSTTDSSTSKRDDGLLGNLVGDLLGKPKEKVTTVVVQSVVVVGPDGKVHKTTPTGIVVGPTGLVSSATKKSPKPAKTTGGGGLLDPVGSLLTGLLGGHPTKNTTAAATPTSKHKKTGKGTKATTTPKPTTTGGGLLDPVGSLLSGLLPHSSSSKNSTAHPTKHRKTTTTPQGLLPTLSLPTLLPPLGSSTTTPSGSEPTQSATNSGGILPSMSQSSPSSASTNVPPVNSSTTATGEGASSAPTTTGTTGPTGSTGATGSGTTNTSPTHTGTAASSAANSTMVPPATTHTHTHTPTHTHPASPVTTSPHSTLPQLSSVKPTTAKVPNSNNWLPTTIVADLTTIAVPTNSPSGPVSSSLPTNIPKVIMPNNLNKPAPEGTVLIQIGFKYALNWMFVAQNTVAAAQIFQFLPQALASAGDFDVDKIQITKLVPYDTRHKWGYITTLVKLYYPEDMVDTLQTQMWAPNSLLYNNKVSVVRDLADNINPKIDLFGGNDPDGSQGSGSSSPGSGSGGGFNSNDGSDQSSKKKATTAGIAVGALGLTVMYGAAMFIVARRYKRKRQTHQRSNSLSSSQASSEMGYAAGSPALMGGALLSRDMSGYGGVAGGRESHGSGRSGAGNSARTANISAPVAAENSLGWN